MTDEITPSQKVGIEEIPRIVEPVDGAMQLTMAIPAGRILDYQARVEKRAQRQVEAINRLLVRIEQLEQVNKEDAAEIARLTGILVERETELADKQVLYDRTAEERNELAATVKSMQEFMSTRDAKHTIDGEPISHAGEVVWEHRLDRTTPIDEAVLALSEHEADGTQPVTSSSHELPTGEERPRHAL